MHVHVDFESLIRIITLNLYELFCGLNHMVRHGDAPSLGVNGGRRQ